jgi:hypothetical protein
MTTDVRRSLDIRAAREIFGRENAGWRTCTDFAAGSFELCVNDIGDKRSKIIPNYTTDIAADYEVLKYIQENWSFDDKYDFAVLCGWDQGSQSLNECPVLNYRPGDWTRAALTVLDLNENPYC